MGKSDKSFALQHSKTKTYEYLEKPNEDRKEEESLKKKI